MNDKSKIRAYGAWVAICIIWGTTYLAIRIGVEDMPPFLFAGSRWIIAGLIFLTFLRLKGYALPNKNELLPLAIIGIALLGFGNGLVVISEQWVPSGLAALMITTVPFMIVLIETIILRKKKINIYIISGLTIGFLGVVLILGVDFESLINSDYFWGIVALFGAVTAWSAGSVYSKYKKLNVHPLMGAAVQMLIAGVLQTCLGLILGEANDLVITEESLLALLYLIIFGSLFGYGSYMYALAHLPVSFVTTYAYINPAIALFAGWLFLAEPLNLNVIRAAAVIIIGVYLVNRGNRLTAVE